MPSKRAAVAPSAVGKIRRILVSMGDGVDRGQPVIQLETDRLENDLRKRKLAVKRAELRLRQALVKVSEGSENGADVSLEQLALEEARMDERDAFRELEGATLRAPLDGVIVQLNVREGDVLAPSAGVSALIMIADLSTLIVELDGDEYEAADVRAGQPALIYMDALRTGPKRGNVLDTPSARRFSTGPSAAAVFSFKVAFSDEVSDRWVGLSARVEIETARRTDVPLIPLRAVDHRREGDYVLVGRRTSPSPVAVRLGLSDGDVVELLHGPKDGTELVVREDKRPAR
jgi:RND family efflux transporter MFP subunit